MTEEIEIQGESVAIEAHEQPLGCLVDITPTADVADAFKDQVFLAASQWAAHWSRDGPQRRGTLTCTRVNGTILVESSDEDVVWSQSAMDDLKRWLLQPMAMSAGAIGTGSKAGEVELASS